MKIKKLSEVSKAPGLRSGSYILLVSVLAIAAAVIINLFISALPENIRHIDTTSNSVFDFSQETLGLLKSLDEDVDIYCISQSGREDPTVQTLLSRYGDRSSHIKISYIDPVIYPNFTAYYSDAELAEGSLIVESGRRFTIVDYSDMYDYRLNYDTYVYDTYFTGESSVTSAVDFVTSENLPTVYALTGHGEISFDSNLSSAIARQNIAVTPLSLLSHPEVPQDCQCLIICSPAADLSAEEAEAILEYLKNGGNMLVFTDYTEEKMPNFRKIFDYYALSLGGGIIIEGDTGHHIAQYPHYILPDIQDHAITEPLVGSYYILEPLCEPISYPEEPVRDTVGISPLLMSSESSFMKKLTDYQISTYEFEDGDEEGPFVTAAAVTEDLRSLEEYSEEALEHEEPDDSEETRIVIFSSSYIAESDISNYVAGANEDMILNSLDWMTQREDSISVSPKQISMDYLSMSEKDSSIGIIFMLGLPMIALATGTVVLIRRTRRKV